LETAGSLGTARKSGALKHTCLLGHFRLFVGARIKSAHDGNLLNSK